MIIAALIFYSDCRTCSSGSFTRMTPFQDFNRMKNFILDNLKDYEVPEFYDILGATTYLKYEVIYQLGSHYALGATIKDDSGKEICRTIMSGTGKKVWEDIK